MINFDEAFETWKDEKIKAEVSEFAVTWGIQKDWLYKAAAKVLSSESDKVPYMDELNNNVDYNDAADKSAGNRLKHMMTLKNKLPEFISEVKQKYN